MDKQALIQLFDDHYRANHLLWDFVTALSDDQFTRSEGGNRPSIRALCVRMMANENLWVDYLWHGEVEFLREEQFLTRDSIRSEWDALEEEIRDFLDELTPAELEREVEPPFLLDGTPLKVSEILLQVTRRGAEGRAQLCQCLDCLGWRAPARPPHSKSLLPQGERDFQPPFSASLLHLSTHATPPLLPLWE